MKFLKSVLHFLISVCSRFVLEFNFAFQSLCFFVVKFCNKKRNQAVKGVFLVAYVVVTQNFFKLIYDFVIAAKVIPSLRLRS